MLSGETQEEHWRNLILTSTDDGASCDAASTRVVHAQSSSCFTQVQMAEALRAINNLAKTQVRKDTPSLIDVNGLGRPKEFCGKEEDFQQWSKKTKAFFAGVIKESETVLEWAAEQTTEITTELINREFLPTATNQERGVQNLEFVLEQMHTALMALTSYEATDIVANSRKTHWRHGGGCRNDMILPPEEGREIFFARSFLRDVALSSGTPSGN